LANVKTYAGTTYATAERALTNSIFKDLNWKWFRYVGGEIDTTRTFCEERNGKYFHRNSIAEWADEGEWSGQIEGTNSENIFVFLGGWNCRHSLIPVTIRRVPESIVADARAKGWDVGDNIDQEKNEQNKPFIKIEGYKGSDLGQIKNFATEYANKIGVKGDVNIIFEYSKKGMSGGGVGWSKPDKDGKRLIRPNIEIKLGSDAKTSSVAQEIIKHEMTHILQSQRGDFYLLSAGEKAIQGIYWKGNKILSVNDYNNLSKLNTLNKFTKYINLPWEKEAWKAGDPYKDRNLQSLIGKYNW
jgi:hypothetical protein